MKKLLIRSDVWENLKAETIGALVCQREYLSQFGIQFDFEVADIDNEFEFIDTEEDTLLNKLKQGESIFFMNGKWRC